MIAENELSNLDIMSLVSDNQEQTESKLEIRQTKRYAKWFQKLRDRKARMRIVSYFEKAQALGDLHGDFKAIGDHVTEVRFDVGPGYRVYVTRKEGTIVLLLVGGDKMTQSRDIEKAKELAKKWRQGHEDL